MKRLVRPSEGKMIAGVCRGISNYTGIDVSVIRLLWAFLLIPGGLPGIIPYVICVVIIPSEN